jgi:hypothetical protein
MLKIVFQKSTSNFIEKTQLVKLKMKAMRAGAWFRNLRRIDRVLIDLTIMVAHNSIRSPALAEGILAVITKLEVLLESNLSKITREVGFPLARKVSSIAEQWGNSSASIWRSDRSFAAFLAVLSINENNLSKQYAIRQQTSSPKSL